MADGAPAGGKGTVNFLFPEFQYMAVETEFFHGHNKLIAPPLVAAFAQLRSVGTVFPVPAPVSASAPARSFCVLHRCRFAGRHTVKRN